MTYSVEGQDTGEVFGTFDDLLEAERYQLDIGLCRGRGENVVIEDRPGEPLTGRRPEHGKAVWAAMGAWDKQDKVLRNFRRGWCWETQVTTKDTPVDPGSRYVGFFLLNETTENKVRRWCVSYLGGF